ncbi:MAG: hypothetical protein KKA07_08390 [Bacteroidetes bacterium]|nr:hypothetical protein [Bacteroidota bacterium]
MTDAQKKDLWVEPIEVSRYLMNFPRRAVDDIQWKNSVDIDCLFDDIKIIAKEILKGEVNSLFSK